MRTKLVRVGRSKAIRLSKAALKAAGIGEEVEISVENGRVVLTRPGWHPREGWAEDARRLAESGDEEDWSDWDNASGEVLEEDWTWPEDFNGRMS
jgi:antitoxin MazE